MKKNGASSFEEFRRLILNYRKDKWNENPSIGCIVLTNPVFFDEPDWLDVPPNWRPSIVQGKSYDTSEATGQLLWEKIESILPKYLLISALGEKSQLTIEEEVEPHYRQAVLKHVRLGQGAFRILVTDAFSRRCAITGERTLPVLEAAHIKAYASSGPHFISNSLLLRSDLHRLFDNGYITITKDYKIEVSRKIKEEFENGKEYYQYQGRDLMYLPNRQADKPGLMYIEWHNNIFKG